MNHYSNTLHTLDSQEEQTVSSPAPHTQSLITRLHDLWAPSLDDLYPISQPVLEPETAETRSFHRDSAADGAYMQPPSSSFGEAKLFYNNELHNSFDESQRLECYWDQPDSAGPPNDDLIEPDSQAQDDSQTQHPPYNFTRTTVPRRVLYSPSYIQFESSYKWGALTVQPTDEDLVSKADSKSYLTLYQRGSLKVRINDKQAWELQCPRGCWVKTNIRSHIPLMTKGQFSNLESHWGTKSCTKSSAAQDSRSASRFALATIFPAQQAQSDLSVGSSSVSL